MDDGVSSFNKECQDNAKSRYIYCCKALHFRCFWGVLATPLNHCTKMKFSIKDFFSKCDQIRSCLRIWSHLPKKSLMENFILSAVNASVVYKIKMKRFSLNQLISNMVSLDTPISRFQSNMLKSTQQELNKNFKQGSSCILKIKYF